MPPAPESASSINIILSDIRPCCYPASAHAETAWVQRSGGAVGQSYLPRRVSVRLHLITNALKRPAPTARASQTARFCGIFRTPMEHGAIEEYLASVEEKFSEEPPAELGVLHSCSYHPLGIVLLIWPRNDTLVVSARLCPPPAPNLPIPQAMSPSTSSTWRLKPSLATRANVRV